MDGMRKDNKRQRFKEIIETDEATLTPIIHDALAAMIVNEVGEFDLVGVSGYGASLSSLGLADAGYISRPEMIEVARRIAATAEAPVFADGDTGFGNALNVRHTIREMIQHTELAGVFIEDQLAPKRCGHVAGKQVISKDEAIGKYRAAVDMRDQLDENFVIIARTDARGAVGGSLEAAIERGNAYAEIGADAIFVEGPSSREEVQCIGKEIHAPLMYNQVGVSPYIGAETLSEWGYTISGVVTTLLPIIVRLYDHLKSLRKEGIEHEASFVKEVADHPVGDLHEFAGFDEVRTLEQEYLPEEEQEKYTESVGHVPGN